MNALDARVAAYVARRHQVLSLAEARMLGASREAVRHRVQSGVWKRLHRGVYLVGQGRPTPLGLCRAAVLAIGGDAVVSHRTAAALHHLCNHGGPIHVTTTRKLPGRPGIVVHWTRDLPSRTTRHGIPCTTLQRTIEDAARHEEVEPLIRSAERLHGLDRRTLRPFARGGTFARGELIKLFLEVCEEAGFVRPETEYRLLGYEIDAVWAAARIAVEVDDYETHDNRDAMDGDRARDRRLLAAGWKPVRVTYAHLTEGRAELVAHLRALGAPLA